MNIVPTFEYDLYKPVFFYSVSYTHLDVYKRQQFFNELASKGGYSLQRAKGTRPEDYRLAYRAGYANFCLLYTSSLRSFVTATTTDGVFMSDTCLGHYVCPVGICYLLPSQVPLLQPLFTFAKAAGSPDAAK